jgi:polysaccharide deacetylase family protein (PEP-CTERM system associated)
MIQSWTGNSRERERFWGPDFLTVDVEDWPQSTVDPQSPISPRVLLNTHHLLDLLAEYGVKATFFVQTLVAERFPSLVERIAWEGHEVASHGHGHIPLFNLTPNDLASDLLRSREILGRLSPQPVDGYRAPDFSVRQDTLWALEILRDCGFRYSSSIFPFRGRRYGMEDHPPYPHSIVRGLTEVPLSVFPLGGRHWPVAGGGYLRLYPYWMTRWAIRRVHSQGRPVVVYLHPYELDPEEVTDYRGRIPASLYWSQSLNRKRTEAKLRRLLEEFRFIPIREGIDL